MNEKRSNILVICIFIVVFCMGFRIFSVRTSQYRSVAEIPDIDKNATELNLDYTYHTLTSLQGIEQYKELVNLTVPNDAAITDISPVSQLKKLGMNSTGIQDLSDITQLTRLRQISIAATNISDISPLASCKELVGIYIQSTNVTDITPLFEMEKLYQLNVAHCDIPVEQIEKLKELFLICTVEGENLLGK